MKQKLLVIAAACVLPVMILQAQSPESADLHVNQVKATVLSNGTLFFDGQDGGFIAPYLPGEAPLSTMRAAGLWMAGVDPGGNLRGAVHLYGEDGQTDFQAGTLAPDTGTPTGSPRGFFRVSKADILQHIADFEDNGVIDSPNPKVFGWPASGNAFFAAYHNGAELPSNESILAPYWDSNGTATYEPNLGDFPALALRGCQGPDMDFIIPDEMLWFVFNDYLLHTESKLPPMQVEVQCTVFGFNCQESPLGNTVFVQYRIKSCSSENLDSAYFGLFADFSIGNPEDDFFGSDAERALIFGYNGDEDDEGGYGNNAPAMAITMLRGPLSTDPIPWTPLPLAHVMPVELNELTDGTAFYNLLRGAYADGTLAPNGGFFYDGNPTVPGEWSEVEAGNIPGDRKVVASYGPFLLQPGAVNELVAAFTFYQAPGNTPLDNVELMYAQSSQIQAFFDQCFDLAAVPACTPFVTAVRPEPRNTRMVNAFPNPFSDELQLQLKDWAAGPVWVELIAPTGQVVWRQQHPGGGGNSLPLAVGALPPGIYWLSVTDANGERGVSKVVKM